MIKILALDPATKFGWAMGPDIGGTWNLTPKKGDHPGKRLDRLSNVLGDTILMHKPDLIVYERAIFMGSNRSNALAVQNNILGIVFLAAYHFRKPLEAYSAMTIKKHVTGTGKATKDMVIASVKTRFLGSGLKIVDDNHADAVALWAMADDIHNGAETPF